MTTVAIVLALLTTVVGLALFVRAIAGIVGTVKTGQPTLGRSDNPGQRWKHLAVESLGHTRMLQVSAVGAAHWFVLVGFIVLFLTLPNAFAQLFNPEAALPLIGHWVVYEWVTEGLAWLTVLAILVLMGIRFFGVGVGKGRFFGSRTWQAVYVELTILGVGVCILVLRALEFQLFYAGPAGHIHFPLTWFLLPAGLATESIQTAIVLVAATKIIISFAWMIVLGLNQTMGVAWHRFTAWPNIWFKRESNGRPALGAAQPLNVGGTALTMESIEDLSEEAIEHLGVGRIDDFTWKGLLDFTSCTECGRCQSQCPAWATDKPLSPKLLVMGLREQAYANQPERPLIDASAPPAVVQAHGGPIQVAADGTAGVIDPDVLWSCTTCGACVQQCPVDIEHVDHILDMRRFEVLVKSEFPEELNSLYKGLESKGNPWNLNKKGRMDWAKDLPFKVPVVGEDVADLTEVDYLFWVGCAGAFEERAKKTTQAVAELLHTAGVSFAVLGKNETCTGDSARRSGNEFLYLQLAEENKETLTEAKVQKIVATCPHCLNTLRNEYRQLGLELDVIHHTQLLNRLVRDGRLRPAPAENGGRTITYHDPCYLGRHNQIYAPPRELIGGIPGATFEEMPRNQEKSFCCGAGGARMWMEESLGTRINRNRTSEALTVLGQADGAAVATGCPFCRVMLSDGVAEEQAAGQGENIEVLDVAQLLLESVRRGQAEPPEPSSEEPSTG